MKRFAFLPLAAAFFLAACSSSKNMLTLGQCGVVLPLDKSCLEKGVSYDEFDTGVVFVFSYQDELEKLYQEAQSKWMNLAPEDQAAYALEYKASLSVHQKTLAYIVVISDEEYQGFLDKEVPGSAMISSMELVGHKDGRTYLRLLPENTTEGMGAEEEAAFLECQEKVRKAVKKMKMIKPSAPDARGEDGAPQDNAIGDIPDFNTVDLYGNPVDSSIFKNKDLTVVNIWGTFCGPCIREMPELGEWAKALPENVQLIGLVCDVNGADDTAGIEEAKDIMGQAHADFVNLVASDSLASYLSAVQFVPTTILVDSLGHLVDEPIVGAKIESYKQAVEKYIETSAK